MISLVLNKYEANHTRKRTVAAVLNEICDELESLEDELRYN